MDALVELVPFEFETNPAPFSLPEEEEEYCHRGILGATRHIMKELLDRNLLSDSVLPPDYNLVLTGHSLGTGVACAIGLFLRRWLRTQLTIAPIFFSKLTKL